jgi:hypothetical protein
MSIEPPKYGYRACWNCGIDIRLICARDVCRKKFCSRKCHGAFRYNNGMASILMEGITPQARATQARSLRRYHERNPDHHPMLGKKLSAKAKAKIRLKQKFRAWTTPSPGRKMKNRRKLARTVMEEKLGRKLVIGEVVHHKDGDHTNDDPTNLECMSWSEHSRLHLLKDWAPGGKRRARIEQSSQNVSGPVKNRKIQGKRR